MFIILLQDTWSQYAIAENNIGRPKLFESKESAFDYAQEMEFCPFQIIRIEI